MEELLKQILKELRKANRKLGNIEELLSQVEDEDDEESEENGKHQLLDGSFYNG